MRNSKGDIVKQKRMSSLINYKLDQFKLLSIRLIDRNICSTKTTYNHNIRVKKRDSYLEGKTYTAVMVLSLCNLNLLHNRIRK